MGPFEPPAHRRRRFDWDLLLGVVVTEGRRSGSGMR
jgi:hypothetical protein